MKEGTDSTAARQAPEKTSEDFVSRKLIRPSLSTSPPRTEPVAERRERLERTDRAPSQSNKRVTPPEQTHAENFYYQKQMQSKTPVVIVLRDGEEVQGLNEWYDKSCIKISRNGAANLLIYKPAIRYIYKAGEARQS